MKKYDETIPAGKFKAQCLKLMDQVHDYHISYTITKHGKPIALLAPFDEQPKPTFGCLKGTVRIMDDIIEPINTDWEVAQ